MSCYHPLRAYRTRGGEVALGKEPPDSTSLRLPCGGCIGCRKARAKEWSLRCHLEMQDHHHTAWTTLTYSDENLPPTLDKPGFQRWLKRLRSRAATPIRFFGCGEYGETFGRPHYHVILYGLPHTAADIIQDTWQLGHTRTYALTPRMISYTAGYTAKKIGHYADRDRWRRCHEQDAQREHVDRSTGEVIYTRCEYRAPFIQMSRRPGIGGSARQWPDSWRMYAVHNGTRMAVPRFLHESWKAQATAEELDALAYEKHNLTLNRDISEERLRAGELIAIKEHERQAQRRAYS